MLGVAAFVFTYYTAWVFVLPFINEDNILNQFFLPRDYAIKLPILLLFIAALGVGTFVGKVLIKINRNRKVRRKHNNWVSFTE